MKVIKKMVIFNKILILRLNFRKQRQIKKAKIIKCCLVNTNLVIIKLQEIYKYR